jgi:hypothetical protein
MPGMYAVTSTPEVRRTRATLRRAELGFLGVAVYTRVHTPRRCGEPFRAGDFVFSFFSSRPCRTSCWMVGTCSAFLGHRPPGGEPSLLGPEPLRASSPLCRPPGAPTCALRATKADCQAGSGDRGRARVPGCPPVDSCVRRSAPTPAVPGATGPPEVTELGVLTIPCQRTVLCATHVPWRGRDGQD